MKNLLRAEMHYLVKSNILTLFLVLLILASLLVYSQCASVQELETRSESRGMEFEEYASLVANKEFYDALSDRTFTFIAAALLSFVIITVGNEGGQLKLYIQSGFTPREVWILKVILVFLISLIFGLAEPICNLIGYRWYLSDLTAQEIVNFLLLRLLNVSLVIPVALFIALLLHKMVPTLIAQLLVLFMMYSGALLRISERLGIIFSSRYDINALQSTLGTSLCVLAFEIFLLGLVIILRGKRLDLYR